MQILIYPISMAVIMIFGLLWKSYKPESTFGRGLAFLGGILLIISAGFVANFFVVLYTVNKDVLMNFVFAVTGIIAFSVFLRAADVISWKVVMYITAAIAAISAGVFIFIR